jgi:hypothetical protein
MFFFFTSVLVGSEFGSFVYGVGEWRQVGIMGEGGREGELGLSPWRYSILNVRDFDM